MVRAAALALIASIALAACGASDGERPTGEDGSAAQAARTTIATGLDTPWGIAFLPGGDALVAERDSGRILRLAPDGRRERTVMTIPGVAGGGGQEGGLLGLAVSPRYRNDGLVYAYCTTTRDNRIVRFRLGGRVRPILTGLRSGAIHNGGRIAFGPDGKLYAGVGETGDPDLAQDRSSENGKILRLNPDGSVPRGNPFPGSRVWSYGHRNVQGLAWDGRGRLWATELGQNSFDEVNLIRKGRNYGWPQVEGKGSTAGGRFVDPVVTWPTSEASPSGAAIRSGTLYIGALQGQDVLRVRLAGARGSKRTPLLKGALGRVRTVVRAPDGSLWVASSNRDGRGEPRSGDDRIVRLR
jgi:glucose/arabinose dehydrogenase